MTVGMIIFKYRHNLLFLMRRTRDSGKKINKIMVYLMGFIMVGSIFGVVFFGFGSGGGTGSVKYNDFKFVNKGSFWSTTFDGREASFTYFPSDVEFIEVNNDIIGRLKNKIEIDATSDFNDAFAKQISLAEYNMGITLNNFNVFVRQGFTAENDYDFPVITCENATDFVPVIYFKSFNETKVYLENSCIIAEALRQDDIERIKDRLVYGMLGIIE
jgi:hypothetical protein|tara:strand:- start:3810 stop:4454 length:645 start_codon:yes stop_codon:yes gene_type:complete